VKLLQITSGYAFAGDGDMNCVIARPYIFQINKGKMTGTSSAISKGGVNPTADQ
jgi:hypothetical protein